MFDVCGVVLAGGKSIRMGSDKAQLPWQGQTFLQAILASMQGLFPQRIVVGRSGLDGDVLFAQDVRTGCGPLGGIYTALLICKSPAALFVSCDTPLLDPTLYAKICMNQDPEHRRIVVSQTGSEDRSEDRYLVPKSGDGWSTMTGFVVPGTDLRFAFPVLIPKTYLPAIRRLLDAGEKSVKSLLGEALLTRVVLNGREEETVHSINTPRAYQELLEKGTLRVA